MIPYCANPCSGMVFSILLTVVIWSGGFSGASATIRTKRQFSYPAERSQGMQMGAANDRYGTAALTFGTGVNAPPAIYSNVYPGSNPLQPLPFQTMIQPLLQANGYNNPQQLQANQSPTNLNNGGYGASPVQQNLPTPTSYSSNNPGFIPNQVQSQSSPANGYRNDGYGAGTIQQPVPLQTGYNNPSYGSNQIQPPVSAAGQYYDGYGAGALQRPVPTQTGYSNPGFSSNPAQQQPVTGTSGYGNPGYGPMQQVAIGPNSFPTASYNSNPVQSVYPGVTYNNNLSPMVFQGQTNPAGGYASVYPLPVNTELQKQAYAYPQGQQQILSQARPVVSGEPFSVGRVVSYPVKTEKMNEVPTGQGVASKYEQAVLPLPMTISSTTGAPEVASTMSSVASTVMTSLGSTVPSTERLTQTPSEMEAQNRTHATIASSSSSTASTVPSSSTAASSNQDVAQTTTTSTSASPNPSTVLPTQTNPSLPQSFFPAPDVVNSSLPVLPVNAIELTRLNSTEQKNTKF